MAPGFQPAGPGRHACLFTAVGLYGSVSLARKVLGVTAGLAEKNLSQSGGQFLSPQPPAQGTHAGYLLNCRARCHPLFPAPQCDARSARPLLRPLGLAVLLLGPVHTHGVCLSLPRSLQGVHPQPQQGLLLQADCAPAEGALALLPSRDTPDSLWKNDSLPRSPPVSVLWSQGPQVKEPKFMQFTVCPQQGAGAVPPGRSGASFLPGLPHIL